MGGRFGLVSCCLISFHFLRFIVSFFSLVFIIQHDHNHRDLLLRRRLFCFHAPTHTYPPACISFSFFRALVPQFCIGTTHRLLFNTYTPPFSPQVGGLALWEAWVFLMTCCPFCSFFFSLVWFTRYGPLNMSRAFHIIF
jgi:hypothetical protein